MSNGNLELAIDEKIKKYEKELDDIIEKIGISFYKDDRVVMANNIPSVDRESHITDLNYCFSRDVYLKGDGVYTGHGGIGINQEMTDLLLKLI
jgi:hypothetical protein